MVAQVRLATDVDEHWRGLYDILVRPADSHLDLERTNGLVEPNFLGFTGKGGISRGQVEAIRRIPGVEVAAPVAYIGLLTTDSPSASIVVSGLPAQPTVYRASLEVMTSDGLSTKVVSRTTVNVLLGAARDGGMPLVAVDTASQDFGVGQYPDGREVVSISTGSFLPPLSSPVLAVDPVSERALLGRSGRFLDPLVELASESPYTASTFSPAKVLAGYDAAVEIGAMSAGPPETQARPVPDIGQHARLCLVVRDAVCRTAGLVDRRPLKRR